MSRVELPPLPPGVAAFTPTRRDHIALEALMRGYGEACARAALEAAAAGCLNKASKMYEHARGPYLDCADAIRALSVGSEGGR